MGNCCTRSENENPTSNIKAQTKGPRGSYQGTHGSMQTHPDPSHSLIELEQTIDRVSRMSVKERQDQADHMLSFKT